MSKIPQVIHFVARPIDCPWLPYMLCRGRKHHRGKYDMYATANVKKVTCENCLKKLRNIALKKSREWEKLTRTQQAAIRAICAGKEAEDE